MKTVHRPSAAPVVLAAALGLLAGPAVAAKRPVAATAAPAPVSVVDVDTTSLLKDDYFTTRFNQLLVELSGNLTSPRAAATLYRINALANDLSSLKPVEAVLAKVADDTRALDEVRTLARYLLADTKVSSSGTAPAQAELSKLAIASDGWIVGGFDNEGGTGHNTAFAPESGPINLEATYPGKERDISWHRVPALGADALVPVGDVIRPRKNATFYYLATLQVPVAERASLYFGTSGATKLWVNGQLAIDEDIDHPARFDQHAVVVPLQKGENVVLLKVSSKEEPMGFYLRAARVGGAPLDKAVFAAPRLDSPVHTSPVKLLAEGAAPAQKPMVYDDLTAQIAKLIQDRPDDGNIRQDYASVLFERRPYDTKTQMARREQEKAASLLPKDALAHLRVARYIEDDHNERRLAVERSLAADPNYAPARAQMGTYYLERGFPRRGYDELSQVVAQHPEYHSGQLGLADALDAMGQTARAQRLQLDLVERFPRTPAVLLSAARVRKSLGQLPEAIALYERVLSLRYDSSEARAELALIKLDAGDVDGAVALHKRALELTPTAIATGLRIADVLSFNGQGSKAQDMYDRFAQLSPDDDGIFEARGQHRLRQGDKAGALKDFQAALALKPQNPHLRELVRSVQPQENFAAPYLRDAVALAAKARTMPVPKDDEVVALGLLDVVRVYPNGLSSRVHQEIVQIVNERGLDRERGQVVRYSPGEQEIKVERARIIKKDGSIVEAKNETDQQVNEAYGGMYFDQRQHIVTFPTLEVGDVLEFTYRRDDISQENMFADYFGDVNFMQGGEPRWDVEYVLIAPSTRTFYMNEPKLPTLKHTEEAASEGRKVWRWSATDVPKVEGEPKMPGWANVAAYLHVSTFKEWDDVAKFWWGLVREQLHVTPEVAAAAEEAVKGIPASDVRGRVRAVYDYVVTKTHYVGLEFGIHGFKPYKVDRILSRRFGDCKDKASLMHAMLVHLGIRSDLVLLRMRNLGQLQMRPASLAVFNHCILYVPELKLYLDGTAEFSGSGELPGSDQGAQVLVVKGDEKGKSDLALTPVTAPEENITKNDVVVDLAPDGSARIEGSAEITGVSAQGYRRAYESESGRRELFEQGYARIYPGAKVTSVDVGDPKAIEKPVATKFVIEVPRLAQKEGEALVFSPFGQPWRYVEGNAPLSKRKFPVDLGAPWRSEFNYTVRLPEGQKLQDVLPDAKGSSPFGSYALRVKKSPEGFVVTGSLTFNADEVSPADYPAFRTFLEEVDRTFSRRLHVAASTLTSAAEAVR